MLYKRHALSLRTGAGNLIITVAPEVSLSIKQVHQSTAYLDWIKRTGDDHDIMITGVDFFDDDSGEVHTLSITVDGKMQLHLYPPKVNVCVVAASYEEEYIVFVERDGTTGKRTIMNVTGDVRWPERVLDTATREAKAKLGLSASVNFLLDQLSPHPNLAAPKMTRQSTTFFKMDISLPRPDDLKWFMKDLQDADVVERGERIVPRMIETAQISSLVEGQSIQDPGTLLSLRQMGFF